MEKGPVDSPAALFILKDDAKNQIAWEDASEIAHARIELHRTKEAFLAGLRNWNAQLTDPANAFLLVYAHGARAGIAPRNSAADLVSWSELREVLSRRLATMWLVGCETTHVKSQWTTPQASPVTASLLVTTASLDWHRLLPLFRAEVDIDSIVFFDQIKSYLRRHVAALGAAVDYLDASGSEWAPFSENEYVDPSEQPALTDDELQALWGVDGPPTSAGCGHEDGPPETVCLTVYRYRCSNCSYVVMCAPRDLGERLSIYCVECSSDFRDRRVADRTIDLVRSTGCPTCLQRWAPSDAPSRSTVVAQSAD